MSHFIASALAAVKLLERECPECHRKQLIRLSERDKAVPCRHCGAAISPKQSDSRSSS